MIDDTLGVLMVKRAKRFLLQCDLVGEGFTSFTFLGMQVSGLSDYGEQLSEATWGSWGNVAPFVENDQRE